MLSPVSKVPAKVAILMQAGLRRTLELSETAVEEMRDQHIVNMVVLVRAAFETACLLYDVVLKCETVVENGDVASLDDFDNYVTNTLLGHGPKAKTFILAEEFVVQNILTVIQRLSKQLDAPFKGFYEGLCEYAHPNYAGLIGVYTEVGHEGGVTTFTNCRKGRDRAATATAGGSLATALGILLRAHERWHHKLLHHSRCFLNEPCLSKGNGHRTWNTRFTGEARPHERGGVANSPS